MGWWTPLLQSRSLHASLQCICITKKRKPNFVPADTPFRSAPAWPSLASVVSLLAFSFWSGGAGVDGLYDSGVCGVLVRTVVRWDRD